MSGNPIDDWGPESDTLKLPTSYETQGKLSIM